LKIALKELNETAIWLRIIHGAFAVDADFLTRLVAENTELCKILVASIQTARRNNKASY
jgi:four helix bundle protein